MKVDSFTLSNGLTVALIDIAAFPSLTTLLLVGAGSRYENSKNNGIAHFFEHMAFKGSKKYPNSHVIASTIESLGGVFNAFTSKDHTGYWIKAPTEDFPTVIDVISDMVLHSKLDREEIEREKGVIVEEINLYEDTPYRKVGEYFEELLYPKQPLGFHIAGSPAGVRSFTKRTFTDYMDKLYHPKNATLVVAGGLDRLVNYKGLVEEKFGKWQNGKKSSLSAVREVQRKPQLLLRYKKTEQSHFCLGFRAFSFKDPRKYALTVLTTILGGGMSSRLFMQVRERRGLCYYISTGRELYHDAGSIVTQAGITNNLDKVKEAIKVILDEHKKIAQGKFEGNEVERAREMLKGNLLLSLEDSFKVASFYGVKQLLEGDVDHPKEVIERIEKVTAAEVVEVARDLFKASSLNLAMIGPFAEAKEIESVLTI